jgi:hypothetical protein
MAHLRLLISNYMVKSAGFMAHIMSRILTRMNGLFVVFTQSSFSKKATKICKNLPLVLTLLIKNSCFIKTGGRFFQILWPSHNVLTLLIEGNDHLVSKNLVNFRSHSGR